MSTYGGHMVLAPNWRDQLEVELLLEDESIRLTSGANLIGEWQMSDVDIEFVGDRIHLFVKGEHLVIASGDVGPIPDPRETVSSRVARWEDVPPTGEPASETTSPRGAHAADDRMLWKW